ncbi:hypothetical protein KBA41_12965 [Candidatus Ozemobacteraceae bacterium]|nr:hypothetical protein [Candidatus Ozemobacteraceae bacterium]
MIDVAVLEQQFAEMVAGAGWLAPAAAFGGGLLTALNPCVLATVPLMIGVVGGYATEKGHAAWKRAALFSLLFVIGFSLELAVLFSVSAAIAPYLSGWAWKYVIAVVCGLLGAHLLFDFQIPGVSVTPTVRWGGYIGILLLGFMFGLVSMPCSGPVLLMLMSLIPEIGVAKAGTLLFLYGIGHSMLILVAGVSVGTVQALADSRGMNRAVAAFKRVAGVLIIGVGLYFLRG